MTNLIHSRPHVSVLIPAYNCGPYVAKAVESVLCQSYRNFEIIVFNDGSTDDTESVLLPYRDRMLYLAGENRGASAARNKAFRVSKGELIAYLDADDLWQPKKLARQVELFEANPEVGVCFTDFTFFSDTQGGDRGFNERNSALLRYPTRQIGNGWRLLDSSVLLEDFLSHQAFPKPSVTMVRRRCLETVGGFDESLQICEDTQMYLRLAKHFAFAYVDEPLVKRRVRKDTLASSADNRRYALVHIQMLETLENWIRLSPRERNMTKKLLASYYRAAAYVHFSEGERLSSRQYWVKSLKTCFSQRAFWYFMLTFLPSDWTRALRQMKRQLAR
jgi:glycosyltransferase involved in cell wall biosynthesis